MPICISFILYHSHPVLSIGLRDPITEPGLEYTDIIGSKSGIMIIHGHPCQIDEGSTKMLKKCMLLQILQISKFRIKLKKEGICQSFARWSSFAMSSLKRQTSEQRERATNRRKYFSSWRYDHDEVRYVSWWLTGFLKLIYDRSLGT